MSTTSHQRQLDVLGCICFTALLAESSVCSVLYRAPVHLPSMACFSLIACWSTVRQQRRSWVQKAQMQLINLNESVSMCNFFFLWSHGVIAYRSVMRGTLQALAFCHSRNVAHGSMGSGSVLLSTFDDRRANDVIVKLDNFGFGRAHYSCSLDLKGGMCMGQDTCASCLAATLYAGPAFLTSSLNCAQLRSFTVMQPALRGPAWFIAKVSSVL